MTSTMGPQKLGSLDRVAGSTTTFMRDRVATHVGGPDYGLGMLAVLSKSKGHSTNMKLPKSRTPMVGMLAFVLMAAS